MMHASTAVMGERALARDQRRLAAIVSADVVGYSLLMGRDDSATLAGLKAHRQELLDPKIAEGRGRIVKTTGDGFLLEFPSVVDAVRCAVDIQREMAERNSGVPPAQRIEFRIGISVGGLVVRLSAGAALGPPLVSVAVMPFAAVSASGEDAGIAEKITQDVTTAAERAMRPARVASLGLEARYKGTSLDPRAFVSD